MTKIEARAARKEAVFAVGDAKIAVLRGADGAWEQLQAAESRLAEIERVAGRGVRLTASQAERWGGR